MHTNKNNVITVFGGTGFLGRHIINALAATGATIRVASRVKQRGYFLKPAGNPGQIVPIFCDIHNDASVDAALNGATHAINLIGILFEKGKRQTFDRLHIDVAERIARMSKKHHLKSLVHFSALGAAKDAPSHYGRSKAIGENKVLHIFGNSVILRPSIVFGPEDDFFNRFARMAQFTSVLPLIGGGDVTFQPVYVGDIAKAVEVIVNHPRPDFFAGRILELGGPEVYSFKALLNLMLNVTGQKALFINIPLPMAKTIGFLAQIMPKPVLTVDQVRSLTKNNILSNDYNGLNELNIQPTTLESILPTYLSRYREGTIFSEMKKTS